MTTIKRTRKWHKQLTLKQLAHLKEMGVTSLAGCRKNFAHQEAQRKEHPTYPEPCWDCREIETRLKDRGVFK